MMAEKRSDLEAARNTGKSLTSGRTETRIIKACKTCAHLWMCRKVQGEHSFWGFAATLAVREDSIVYELMISYHRVHNQAEETCKA